jgi:PAS domain S-box-containing protein
MSDKPVLILLIEDNDADARLMQEMLADAERNASTAPLFRLECAKCLKDGMERLAGGGVDIVLLDLSLPDSAGLGTLTKVRDRAPEIPVIVLTGLDDQETAIWSVREGAQDYLIKGQTDSNLLTKSIRYAIERRRAQEALRESEERYRIVSGLVSDFAYAYRIEPDGTFVREWATRAFQRITGYAPEEVDAREGMGSIVHPEDLSASIERVRRLHSGQSDVSELRIVTRDGKVRWLRFHGLPEWDEMQGRVVRIYSAAQDITKRKRAEEALRRRDAILETVTYGAEQFLRGGEWQSQVHEFLERLGTAMDVSRAYIFENFHDGQLMMGQRFEWAAPGVTAQIDNEAYQAIPYQGTGFDAWVDTLGRGDVLCAHTRDFSPQVQEIFREQDILSIATVPIFVGDTWWGFIGFDECKQERAWSAIEIDALRAVADTLGAAIQRQQTERTLRASEAELAAIFDSAPIVMVLVDRDRRVRKVNRSTADFARRPLDEMVGLRGGEALRCLNALDHPDGCGFGPACQRCAVRRAVTDTLETGKSHHRVEARLPVAHDGGQEKVALLVSTTPLKAIMDPVALVCIEDVTERKRAEEALREREATLRSILRAAPTGIGVITNRVLGWTNERFQEMLGYTADELVGQSARIAYPSDAEYERVGREKYAEIREQGTGTIETHFQRKDGSIIDVLLSSSPIDPTDLSAGVTFTALDITERKRAERLLQALNRAALAMEEALTPDDIFAAVSRELGGIGLSCMVLPVDESQDRLLTTYLSFPDELLQAVEKRVGRKHESFSVAIEDVDLYRRVVYEKETVFVPDGTVPMRQVLPKPVKVLARQLVKMLHMERAIAAPLVVGNRVIGVFTVQADDLLEADVSAITAFAHQVAAAWRKAQFFVQLRQERDRAQKYLDVAGVMLLALNENAGIVLINRTGCEILGYNEKELLGKNWHDTCLPVHVRSEIQSVFGRLMAGQIEPLRYFEHMVLTKPGEKRWIAWYNTIVRDETGNVVGTFSSGEDITERKRAEEALAHRMEQLTTLNRASQAVTASLELDQVLAEVVSLTGEVAGSDYASVLLVRNGEVRRGLGDLPGIPPIGHRIRDRGLTDWIIRTRQPILVDDIDESGRPIPELCADAPRTINPLVVEAGIRSVAGLPLVAKDRLLGVLYLHSSQPYSFHDQPELLSTFANQAAIAIDNARLYADLQDRMQELTRTQNQLIQSAKLAAVGELAAGVAHEVNNPLTSIVGLTDLILQDLGDSDPVKHDLQIIEQEALRTRSIVRGLLDFARQTEPHIVPADVSEIVHSTVNLVRHQAMLTMVTIEEMYDETLPLVPLDADQVKQVFLNLMTNGIQAMPTGGRLKVVTRMRRMPTPGANTSSGQNKTDHVAIEFHDAGVGIPEKDLGRIFDPFFTTKETGQGTGLGLSISQSIIEKHGGRIEVKSQEGHGSVFAVVLPLSRPQPARGQRSSSLGDFAPTHSPCSADAV